MSLIEFLVATANAPFSVAAGMAVVFFVVQVTGLLGLLAGDGHHDGAHDAGHEGAASAFLAPLGVGRVPLSVIVQAYLVSFAVTGFTINALSDGVPTPTSLAWTLPASLVAGYAVVAALARVLGPILSSKKEDATTKADLVGQRAVVISSRVTGDFGEVRIADKSGHQLRLVCKLQSGEPEVPEGRDVVIVEYDPAHGEIVVAPIEEEEEMERRSSWSRT